MSNSKPKPAAKAKSAGTTNTTKGSVVRCEVNLEKGSWISPNSCKTFYIDEDAKFPDITYEIKTDEPGPYEWSWVITWTAMACPQQKDKMRFTPPSGVKTFTEKGSFTSDTKTWKADLNSKILGGELTVKVKAGGTTFIRKTIILGKNPSEEKVATELDTYAKEQSDLVRLAKLIFKQESRYQQFYTDDMPLTSFDKGFGLGQLTNPAPNYEQVWSWKKHVTHIINTALPEKRTTAKKYLDSHPGYTSDMFDLETLAAYNGTPKKQRYHNWDMTEKKWVINKNVVCDPSQSNTGWLMTENSNKGKKLNELQSDKDAKPFYTGRCYAEHIKNSN